MLPDEEAAIDRILALKAKINEACDQHLREHATPFDKAVAFSDVMAALTTIIGERIWKECRQPQHLMTGVNLAAKHIVEGALQEMRREAPPAGQRTN